MMNEDFGVDQKGTGSAYRDPRHLLPERGLHRLERLEAAVRGGEGQQVHQAPRRGDLLLALEPAQVHRAQGGFGGRPSRSGLLSTTNTTRKATVAYPTVKRLLFHMFCVTHPQKLKRTLKWCD